MNSPFVLDVDTASFEKDVLEASKQVPVIVDFWAPWCGPCRALGPILEKLAVEYAGRFRLVKVNSDENMELSQQLNVRSIPDVRAFRDGRLVDQFMGALPERQVRAFIDRLIPPPAEEKRLQAARLAGENDVAGAIAALRESVDLDPAHHLARLDLAGLLIDAGLHDDAERQLENVQADPDWDARLETLRRAIAFARASGSEIELAARVASDPGDLEARLSLAGVLAARKAWRESMDELLEVVRRNKSWRDGEARRQMLAIFNLAAGQPDLVSEYRRKLASVLN